jgi:hypothetical protein
MRTNVVGSFRLVSFAFGAAYLWRTGLFPKSSEPKERLDRAGCASSALFCAYAHHASASRHDAKDGERLPIRN